LKKCGSTQSIYLPKWFHDKVGYLSKVNVLQLTLSLLLHTWLMEHFFFGQPFKYKRYYNYIHWGNCMWCKLVYETLKFICCLCQYNYEEDFLSNEIEWKWVGWVSPSQASFSLIGWFQEKMLLSICYMSFPLFHQHKNWTIFSPQF